MTQKKLNERAESYGRMKTADRDMQVAFTDSFRDGAKWGYGQGTERILGALGIYLVCTKDNHSEEMPWVWSVNKKQQGSWGGSATYYAPEKTGEAKTYEEASEQALQEAIKIIKS